MEQVYSASAVSRPFWYVEFKKVMTLLNKGLSYEEIRAKVLEDNIFDVAKEYRAKEIYGAKKVSLGVFENNESAYHCYKAAGFQEVVPDKSEMYSILNEEWKCLELGINL